MEIIIIKSSALYDMALTKLSIMLSLICSITSLPVNTSAVKPTLFFSRQHANQISLSANQDKLICARVVLKTVLSCSGKYLDALIIR